MRKIAGQTWYFSGKQANYEMVVSKQSPSEVKMLMHQGIGLARFNALPRTHARHALYECCCSVVWADKLVDARPYDSYAALFTHADSELSALSESDIESVTQGYRNLIDDHSEREACCAELARINRIRIRRMLGPEEGYPEY